MKIKENKNMNEFLDLARELKKLWNMRVTVITIVADALGIVRKGLENRLEKLEIRRRINTIQTTALLKSARIHWRVLVTLGDMMS